MDQNLNSSPGAGEPSTPTPLMWSLKHAALLSELQIIVKGFEHEAMNGVICVPPDDELGFPIWEAPTNRTWCAHCRALWRRLRMLAQPPATNAAGCGPDQRVSPCAPPSDSSSDFPIPEAGARPEPPTAGLLAHKVALEHAVKALDAARRTFGGHDADHPVREHIDAALAEIEYLVQTSAPSTEAGGRAQPEEIQEGEAARVDSQRLSEGRDLPHRNEGDTSTRLWLDPMGSCPFYNVFLFADGRMLVDGSRSSGIVMRGVIRDGVHFESYETFARIAFFIPMRKDERTPLRSDRVPIAPSAPLADGHAETLPLPADLSSFRASLLALRDKWNRTATVEREAATPAMQKRDLRGYDLLHESADTYEICANELQILLTGGQ